MFLSPNIQIRSDSYDIRVTSQTYSYYHTDHPLYEVIGRQRCIASQRVSFYTPTNTHVHLSAPRLFFPFSGLRAFRSNRYLFYNEVFINTQFKSDIYQVSINVDKNIKCQCPLLQNLTSLQVLIPISIECVTHDVVVVESTYSRLTAQPYIDPV